MRVSLPVRSLVVSLLLGLLIGSFVTNRFAYQIEELDSRTRVLLRNGSTELRTFDKHGIPISRDPRNQREFISPFYVVHYGLIYSRECPQYGKSTQYHWAENPTEKSWNVPPKKVSIEFFRFAANWVVNAIQKDKFGNAHLFYNFNWSIPHLQGGPLTAPWWSGLADAQAIPLLLRARDCLGGARYDKAAAELYQSVVRPFQAGGSRTTLNGEPWIEEYADNNLKEKNLSYVFNGMVYAYHGVKAFEDERKIDGWAPSLEKSIYDNAQDFSQGYWSWYDHVGNAANIKYHQVNLALIEDNRLNSSLLAGLTKKWRIGAQFPLVFYILDGPNSVAKWHFIFSWFMIVAMFSCLISLIIFFFNRRYE